MPIMCLCILGKNFPFPCKIMIVCLHISSHWSNLFSLPALLPSPPAFPCTHAYHIQSPHHFPCLYVFIACCHNLTSSLIITLSNSFLSTHLLCISLPLICAPLYLLLILTVHFRSCLLCQFFALMLQTTKRVARNT